MQIHNVFNIIILTKHPQHLSYYEIPLKKKMRELKYFPKTLKNLSNNLMSGLSAELKFV